MRLFLLMTVVATWACDDADPGEGAGDAGDGAVQVDRGASDGAPAIDGGAPPDGAPIADAAPTPDAGPPPIITNVRTMTASGVHPGGGVRTCLQVGCEDGQFILGGGGEWPPDLILTDDRPPNVRAWQICGTSEAGGEWVARARCGDVVGAPQIVSGAGRFGPDPDCVNVACPAGTTRIGGGAGWRAVASNTASAPAFESEWSACGSSPADTDVLVAAICLAGATVDTSNRAGNHPTLPDICLEASCAEGWVPIGGGGRWDRPIVRTTSTPTGLRGWSICGESAERADWVVTTFCVPEG